MLIGLIHVCSVLIDSVDRRNDWF